MIVLRESGKTLLSRQKQRQVGINILNIPADSTVRERPRRAMRVPTRYASARHAAPAALTLYIGAHDAY